MKLLSVFFLLFAGGCAVQIPARPPTGVMQGVASYYGEQYNGNRTANGERFNPKAFTAAHKTLPFGTKVLVTFPESDKAVVVKINDRGPFKEGRDIDLSEAAADALEMKRKGVARVLLEAF